MTPEENNQKARVKVVPAVYLFLRRKKGTEVFLRLRQNTGYMDGFWDVPSGHLEKDESPARAVVREGREEAGVSVDLEDCECVHSMYREAVDHTGARVDLFFEAYRWEGEPHNAEPEKCTEAQWVRLSELPENVVPHIRHAIVQIEEGVSYSELNADWFKERGFYKL